MSRRSKKPETYSRQVEGLEYKYPLSVGDECYYITKEGKVLNSTAYSKRIVMEVGVPIDVNPTITKVKHYDGHVQHVKEESGTFKEGVRVSFYNGFDPKDGYQENKFVGSLIKIEDYNKIMEIE